MRELSETTSKSRKQTKTAGQELDSLHDDNFTFFASVMDGDHMLELLGLAVPADEVLMPPGIKMVTANGERVTVLTDEAVLAKQKAEAALAQTIRKMVTTLQGLKLKVVDILAQKGHKKASRDFTDSQLRGKDSELQTLIDKWECVVRTSQLPEKGAATSAEDIKKEMKGDATLVWQVDNYVKTARSMMQA